LPQKPPQSRKTTPLLPSKDDLLAFIGEHPGKAGIREIARAFGLKNEMRAELRHMIRELADEGRIAARRTGLHHAGALPSVTLADVTGRDSDGELIAVPTEWDEVANGQPPSIRIETLRKPRPGTVAGVGDRALLRVIETGETETRYSGRVIKVIDKGRDRALGIFRASPQGGGRLEPIDKKQLGRELIIAPHATGEARDGDLVAVSVVKTGRFGRPSAKVEERLGSLKSERAVSQIAIHVHGIPDAFPKPVLDEAEALKPATTAGREDWRKLPLVTIDPVDAKDHDDAVHAEPDPDKSNPGGFVITVAIADVAYAVKPGSALDREAEKRGNSVYFPDRVVPMLPERISNDLCSLRPKEDRAALAVRMVIGADGQKRSHTFHRVLMRSAAKLNYAQVQTAIDGRPDAETDPLLDGLLKPLYDAYAALKRARDARGPLDLDLPERKIILKPDGHVDRVITPPRLEAHRLIEEYMILANVAAAETLEKARVPLIYRVHDEPSLEKIEALRQFLDTLHISMPKGGALRAAQFNRILDRVKGKDGEKLVNEVVLRAQSQAEYTADNYGHFGLNLRRYAHFTSPIRRYADLIVHRGLIRAGSLGPDGLPADQDRAALNEIAAQISAAERRAMKAERETNDRLIAHHLSDRIGASFQGHISGVTRAGLFIKLDDTGADGFVPARTIGDDYFQYEEALHAMIGRHSGETYRLGDAVTVKLVEAAPVAGALRFQLLSSGSETPAGHSPERKGRPAQRHPAPRGRNKGPQRQPSKKARTVRSGGGRGKRK